MGTQHSTRASRAGSRTTRSRRSRYSLHPDSQTYLSAILGRLSDVSGTFEVICRSLENEDIERVSHSRNPEAITLRHGLSLLSAVYTEFDAAIPAPTDAQLTALARARARS